MMIGDDDYCSDGDGIFDDGMIIFSSFMRAHSPAINEYRGGETSTEVVVDRNLWMEIVDRRRK